MGRYITKEIIRDFCSHLRREEKSRATVEKYVRDVKAFAGYASGNEITKETAIGYKDCLMARGYAISSVNSMMASLNSLFKFLGWTDLRLKSIKIQPKAYCPEEKELDKDEYMRLISAAKQKGDVRMSLMLQTICGTGIRVSELEYITIEDVKSGQPVVMCKGKGRTVLIPGKLRKKLIKYAGSRHIKSGAIFITRNGNPISRTNIWKGMKRLCADAGVNPSKVFPHNLRHLFARTFYERGKDIAKLADILGHKSIDTTRIYVTATSREYYRCIENMRLII